MPTIEGETIFWAPVNVGATKIPTIVAYTGDFVDECGLLFQWGRQYGFPASEDAIDVNNAKIDGYPTGPDYFTTISKWDGKYIEDSYSEPNTKGNWLLFDANEDNPEDTKMIADAWYQKLWNNGTKDNPIKTKSDPCPEGWRIPSYEELAYLCNLPYIHGEGILSISGVEKGMYLVLPAAGRRIRGGLNGYQGHTGFYWSSSVELRSNDAKGISFYSSRFESRTDVRSKAYSVRCIQE